MQIMMVNELIFEFMLLYNYFPPCHQMGIILWLVGQDTKSFVFSPEIYSTFLLGCSLIPCNMRPKFVGCELLTSKL